MTETHKIRAADHVRHKPSGETWVVLWANAEHDQLAAAGWPSGVVKLSDCELVKAATDEDHNALLDSLERAVDGPAPWFGAVKAIRIYRPQKIPSAYLKAEAEQVAIIRDLIHEAGRRASGAAMDVAQLGEGRDAGSVMWGAAFKLIVDAATTFAVLKHRDPARAMNRHDPATVDVVRAMGAALALYPDTVAMDIHFAKAIGAKLMA